jgi:hypothetical protein
MSDPYVRDSWPSAGLEFCSGCQPHHATVAGEMLYQVVVKAGDEPEVWCGAAMVAVQVGIPVKRLLLKAGQGWVSAFWDEYVTSLVAPVLTEEEIPVARAAFYGGVSAMLGGLMSTMDPESEEATDQDRNFVVDVATELGWVKSDA